MMLDVLPQNNNLLNCFELNAYSILKWMGMESHFVFSESWNFGFSERIVDSDGNHIPLVDRIQVNRVAAMDLLEQLYGVRLVTEPVIGSPAVKIKEIQDELSRGNPVIVFFDSYYCPWCNDFQKKHEFEHSFIVIGLDEEKRIVQCVDPFFTKQREEMDLDSFMKGIHGHLHILEKVSLQQGKNYEDLFRRITRTLAANTNPNDIRRFAEALRSITMQDLLHGVGQNVWESKLFHHFNNIVYGRHHFAETLSYLRQFYLPERMESLNRHANEITSQWRSVHMLLFKVLLLKDYKEQLNAIIDRLLEIADHEERFIESLSLEASIASFTPKYEAPAFTDSQAAAKLKGYALPLDDFFNNKGFGISASEADGANFNGLSEYLCEQDHVTEERKETLFNPAALQGKRYDNISCMGQRIQVEGRAESFLQIIGTSEFGDWKGGVTLQLSSGRSLEIELMLPEWCSPHDIKMKIWSGQMIHRGYTTPARLYAQAYNLRPLSSEGETLTAITLPNLPNMHIFSIIVG